MRKIIGALLTVLGFVWVVGIAISFWLERGIVGWIIGSQAKWMGSYSQTLTFVLSMCVAFLPVVFVATNLDKIGKIMGKDTPPKTPTKRSQWARGSNASRLVLSIAFYGLLVLGIALFGLSVFGAKKYWGSSEIPAIDSIQEVQAMAGMLPEQFRSNELMRLLEYKGVAGIGKKKSGASSSYVWASPLEKGAASQNIYLLMTSPEIEEFKQNLVRGPEAFKDTRFFNYCTLRRQPLPYLIRNQFDGGSDEWFPIVISTANNHFWLYTSIGSFVFACVFLYSWKVGAKG